MKDVLIGILSHNLSTIVVAVCALVGLVLGSKAARKRQVALAVFHAFHIVEDVAAEMGPSGAKLDKALTGLKAADDYMKAQGWRPLKREEEDVAKLTFKSMNAQANAQTAVVVGAVTSPK